MHNNMVVITGSAHPDLGQRIANNLNIALLNVEASRFSDGEIQIKLLENIRGTDAFIVQPTMPPAENIIELLLLIDAVKRASCRRVTAVIPYFGYARQDRKDQPRVPIGAKLMADLITTAGADRVLTIDLHAPQIQGFFNIPLDHIYSAPVLLSYFEGKSHDNLAVVAPDVGSIKMARALAKRLDADLAIIDKRRPRPNEAVIMNFIGDVVGRDVVIFDDMIDTAGTLTDAARVCIEDHGALSVTAVCTHPLFSGRALERLNDTPIDQVVVTNTIPFDRFDQCKKIKVLDIAPLLADAIERIHLEKTVSALFV